MRIALVLEYDGSSFCGWQSQQSRDSVQDAVEAAVSTIAGGNIRVIAAGRTDAGVHALYQVLHFDTQAQRPAAPGYEVLMRYCPTASQCCGHHRYPMRSMPDIQPLNAAIAMCY